MLDIRWMKKQNYLRPGTLGTLVWTCRGEDSGSVSFRTESDQLVLNYRSRLSGDECESVEDRIPFTWTKCNYGGQRQWFLCPECHRRVGLVYGGRYFRCRHCNNLTYASQQIVKEDRLMEKARNIRKRLGGGNNLLEPFPMKPKNMHWKTYWRLWKTAHEAHTYMLMIGAKRLGIDQKRRANSNK